MLTALSSRRLRAACASVVRSSSPVSMQNRTLHARRQCLPKPSASYLGCERRAAPNGWAFVHRCPTHCPRSAPLRRMRGASPGLATPTWYSHTPPHPRGGPAWAGGGVGSAVGQGHVGLTQSAATALPVPDVVAGRTPPLDLAPFR